MDIKLGVYRHFKGRYYRVTGVALHSETMEEMVVYEPLYGEGGWWVRPLRMFVARVQHEGRELGRFEYVGESIPSEPGTAASGIGPG